MKILILSTNSNAYFKDYFHAYLVKQGHEVVNITLFDLFNAGFSQSISFECSIDEFSFEYHGRQYALSAFDVIWKRRFDFSFLRYVLRKRDYDDYPPSVHEYLSREVRVVQDFILRLARQKEIPIINDFDESVINKLFQINIARKLGVKVPEFLFTNARDRMEPFYQAHALTVTKPASNFGYIFDGEDTLSHRTSIVKPDAVNQLPQSFFPSFFQQGIQNQYELKCLYIGGEVFAVKQSVKEKKQVADIKQEYKEKNIENTEYPVPESLKTSIRSLCEFFRLDLCTLDFIRTEEGDYYFVEINQDGIIDYYGSFISTNIYETFYKKVIDGKVQ